MMDQGVLRLQHGPVLAPCVNDLYQWSRHEEESVQFDPAALKIGLFADCFQLPERGKAIRVAGQAAVMQAMRVEKAVLGGVARRSRAQRMKSG